VRRHTVNICGIYFLSQRTQLFLFLLGIPQTRLFATYTGIGEEARLMESIQIMADYVDKIIYARLQDTDLENKHDLLSLYINHGKSRGQKHMLEVDFLRDTIMNFMIAGRDVGFFVVRIIFCLDRVRSQLTIPRTQLFLTFSRPFYSCEHTAPYPPKKESELDVYPSFVCRLLRNLSLIVRRL
jgi:hypothetical protein